MRIVNPLDPNGSGLFLLNATEHPVNSTFTVEFYIQSVANLTAWNIVVAWNGSLIGFDSAFVPDDNVFSQAVADGGIFIPAMPVDTSLDIVTGLTTASAGAATLNMSDPLGVCRVTVVDKAILFKMNFTILGDPGPTSILQTNVDLQKYTGSYLASYIYKYAQSEPIEVSLEPAVVKVYGNDADLSANMLIDLAADSVTVVMIGVQDVPEIFVGEVNNIVAEFSNLGTELETFNYTIMLNNTVIARSTMILFPNQTATAPTLAWNASSDFPQGNYILAANVEPLAGENNTSNNVASFSVPVIRRLLGLEYMSWLIQLWISTPLGALILSYGIVALALYTFIIARERLQARSSKLKRSS